MTRMVKLVGHNVAEDDRDAIFRIANMCEFGSLVKIFRMRYTEKNRLQGITGQAFNDGKTVGNAEGVLGDVNFLLDIVTEAAKSNDG